MTLATACPRCSHGLSNGRDEPFCVRCGYVDYNAASKAQLRERTTLLGQGTRYVLRYVGNYPYLTDTLCQVRVLQARNHTQYGVNCPFCQQGMTRTSLSGKRREIREERYKCSQGHRVSLAPGPDGELGWK